MGDDHRAGDCIASVAQHRVVIRNVRIHVANEQPLLADIYALPSASDAGLVCTNVRGLDGKHPVFIDQVGSTFFFPYHVVRFLEIPAGTEQDLGLGTPGAPAHEASDAEAAQPGVTHESSDGVPEPDAASLGPGDLLPVLVGASSDAPGEDDPEAELEIDEDFLQRIRDI
jgi:hypothetical protein